MLAMLVPSAHAVAGNELVYRVVVPWNRPVERLPYIRRATELLGFSSLGELGETALRLSASGQTSLCSVVEILADSLEDAQ